jgi:transcriptional regulator with XRE-family HTH domain
MVKLSWKKIVVIDHELTGTNCRKERERLRISLSLVAQRMRKSPTYLSELERGRIRWTEDLVGQYQNALDNKTITFKPPMQTRKFVKQAA